MSRRNWRTTTDCFLQTTPPRKRGNPNYLQHWTPLFLGHCLGESDKPPDHSRLLYTAVPLQVIGHVVMILWVWVVTVLGWPRSVVGVRRVGVGWLSGPHCWCFLLCSVSVGPKGRTGDHKSSGLVRDAAVSQKTRHLKCGALTVPTSDSEICYPVISS